MKKTTLTLILYLISLVAIADDNGGILEISRNGFVITILNFEDGDKLKLFEVESFDHILTKTTNQLDLTLMPLGKYLLENSSGQSIVIERLELELYAENENGEFVLIEEENEEENFEYVENDAEYDDSYVAEENTSEEYPLISENGVVIEENQSYNDDEGAEFTTDIEAFSPFYKHSSAALLKIRKEGNIITVIDFEDGDKIKLFETEDIVHVLTKTTAVIDLSQLPKGSYFLENSTGASVIIEKNASPDEVYEMD